MEAPMATPERRLVELGISLPPRTDSPVAIALCVQDDALLYVSGHGPEDHDGNVLCHGQVGTEVTITQAKEAARAAGVQLLRTLRDYLGDLDRVERVIKALVFVNCAGDFSQQPEVANGFSELMQEVFGEAGVHARSAVGVSDLPRNQTVEVELLARVRVAPDRAR